MSDKILQLFYEALVQSTLSFCITCWGGNMTSQGRKRLTRVIKTASKISGHSFPSLDDLYEIAIRRKSTAILNDTSHPLHEYYAIAHSGHRYLSIQARTNRLRDSFVPTSIRAINNEMGRKRQK